MLPNNFIFSQTESLFQSKLDSNEIKNEAIAFMADTGRIWTHGTWFATPLTAEDIQNLIEGSTTGNTISFKNGDAWSTPIDFDNFLSKDNTLEYTPTGDYNPATKKYVDNQITERDNVLILDESDFVGATITSELSQELINASTNGKSVIIKTTNGVFPVTLETSGDSLTIHYNVPIEKNENGYTIQTKTISINTTDNSSTVNSTDTISLLTNGDGTKYLGDDGSYKTFPDMATVVELNSAVLALTNDSSSEEIIAAFDSAAQFSNLITQIRDSDNIVNEVLLDTDGYIGHINASLAVSKTDEIIHIRFIDNNDKLVFITVTNNAGTFSCTRTESELGIGDGISYIFNIDNIITEENDVKIDKTYRDELYNAINDNKIIIVREDNGNYCIATSSRNTGSGNNMPVIIFVDYEVIQYIRINDVLHDDNTYTVSVSHNYIPSFHVEGDGTKFLSDDGTYKTIEVGDKTNVLILSLENDLANGQKDSPVNAEVSASLVDAVTTGKACVIKSANSDILANLQQIGNNVTIIMEQISRVGQTFVAVNTSITVNTSTNVIADYQTGAIVLETEGNGTKFLSDDGTYKSVDTSKIDSIITDGDGNSYLSNDGTYKTINVKSDVVYYLDIDNFSEQSGTISSTLYNEIKDAIESRKVIIVTAAGGDYKYTCELTTLSEGKDFQIFYSIAPGTVEISILSDYSYTTFTHELVTDNDVLTKNNTTEYTPTSDYHPATKKYVDEHSADLSNYLAKDNTTEYEPAEEYNPATKGYVDQELINIFYGHVVNVEDIMDGTRTTGRYTYRDGTLYDAITFAYDGDPVGVIVIPCRFQEDQGGGPQTWTSEYPYKSTCIVNINGSYIEITISAYLNPVSGAATSYQLWVDFSWKYLYRVMTESEYSALGDSTASDNVLYFITPD